MRNSLAFYLLSNGFQVFRRRVEQELIAMRGLSLSECADDEDLFRMYQRGEPTSYVLASIAGSSERDGED